MTALIRSKFAAALASRLGACVLLVLVADFLFFGQLFRGQDIGWTLGLFCFLTLCAAAFFSPAAVRRPFGLALLAICIVLCLTLVETVNWLAFLLFGLFFAALFADMRLEQAPTTWLRKLFVFGFYVSGVAVIADGLTFGRHWRQISGRSFLPGLFSGWLLPAMVGTVFLLLFASANPIIENWLLKLDWEAADKFLTPERLVFWLVAGVMVWGALRASGIRIADRRVDAAASPDSPMIAFLFSRDGVIRSLVIANLLFLAQNVLDANFLWHHAALPQGIGYAEYAHRGAYPLILTGLLAAAFVLIAMRENGGFSEDRSIRVLIFAWMFQNLVLAISSIQRASLYISEYSLTYLRLAALLWMGLVLVGLMLVVWKIAGNKSSSWLIKANLAAMLALLVGTCFVDMGRFIADYNVAHSKELRGSQQSSGGGYFLDIDYLRVIGPSALPAIRRALTQTPVGNPAYLSIKWPRLEQLSRDLHAELEGACMDWRRWTYRAHRLCKDMKPQPAADPAI